MKIVGRVIVVVLCLAGGAALALGAAAMFPQLLAFGTTVETNDSQVINAITTTEEVALVSLGIQGITETRADSEILGVTVPGSQRAVFIQYSFNAKLGIDGAEVSVTPIGENSYRVSIPEFIFIGHDGIEFKSAAEDNGLLSWVTADIDALDVVNDVLDDDAQLQHVESNRELLQEQAEAFYTSIIRSVDPAIDVAFEYAD